MRLMRLMATLCLGWAVAGPALPRSLAITDVLRLEAFGRSEVSADRSTAIYERLGPYADMTSFGAATTNAQNRYRLMAVDLRTGKTRTLLAEPRVSFQLVGFSPSGRRLAYMRFDGLRFQLGVLEIATGRKTEFTPSLEPAFVRPEWVSEDELVAATAAAGQASILVTQSNMDHDHAVTEIGRMTQLWRAQDRGQAATVWVNGAGRYSDVAARRTAGGLVLADLRTRRAKVLMLGEATQVALSPNGRRLAVVRVRDKQEGLLAHVSPPPARDRTFMAPRESEVLIFDLTTGAPPQPACDSCRLIEGDIGWTTDSERVAFNVKSPPPAPSPITQRTDHLVTRLELDGRALAEVNTGLREVDLGWSMKIEHAGANGPLTSWLLLPPGHTGGKLPTVVIQYPQMRYGDPTQGELSPFMEVRLLAARGYAVLFASTSKRQPGVLWDPSKILLQDTNHAVDAAIATGLVDPDRLAIMGHSNGGFATALIASQTDRYKAAIPMSGVYDYAGFVGHSSSLTPKQVEDGEWVGMAKQIFNVEPPWSKDRDWYVDNTVYYRADHIHTPMMIIHGDLDWVNPSGAMELFKLLRFQGKDAVLLRYIGENHHFHSPANIADMWSRIGSFLDEHIGPPAPGGFSKSASLAF